PDGSTVTTGALLAESPELPLLLVFFKVSCPTCKLAWPFLERLHRAYGGRAVRVIGVAQDPAPEARAFFAEFGAASFELLLDPPPYAASGAFDVESVPHLALAAPDGALETPFEGWSRRGLEELGARFASALGLDPTPLVADEDGVPAFKPG